MVLNEGEFMMSQIMFAMSFYHIRQGPCHIHLHKHASHCSQIPQLHNDLNHTRTKIIAMNQNIQRRVVDIPAISLYVRGLYTLHPNLLWWSSLSWIWNDWEILTLCNQFANMVQPTTFHSTRLIPTPLPCVGAQLLDHKDVHAFRVGWSNLCWDSSKWFGGMSVQGCLLGS